MTSLCRLSFLLFVLIQSQALAQQPRVIIVNSTSKELKRAAHRLRIPVEQLKNARQALQEATDLVSRMDPYPTDQLSSLAQSWQNLNRSKAKDIIDSFIQNLRYQASQAKDFSSYQRATSAAMTIVQQSSQSDSEKAQDMIRSWPDAPESFGAAAAIYRKDLETQVKNRELSRLAISDPEKALKMLSQSGGVGSNFSASAQIAQRLMSTGKNKEALKIIDQGIADFSQRSGDTRAISEFQSFVQITAQIDQKRAGEALNKLVTQMINRQQPTCNAKLKTGDTSLDVTCGEMSIISLLRSFSSKPAIASQALNSLPALKAKLDSAGGLDNVFSGQSSMVVNMGSGQGQISLGTSAVASQNNLSKLTKELQGKPEISPAVARQKIQNAVRGPEDIDLLINLATSLASQDPDLAGVALEIAEPLLPQIESLQKRSTSLQSLIRAYRQVDGEVDPDLLKTGFIVADQLRQEQSDNTKRAPITSSIMTAGMTVADRLESFLVAETARDYFDAAISYVRSMETGPLKLTSMLQIVQALSQSNF